MTHVVTDNCIRCKYATCASVCPVSCFHEGENMLVIDPDVCIDCGLCVLECAANAIVVDDESAEFIGWVRINRKYSKEWSRIL